MWRFVWIPVGCCLCISHKASWCSCLACKFLLKVQHASRSSTRLDVSSLFPSDAAFAFVRFCNPLLKVQHQFFLDNVMGLLSRSLSSGWVAILTRLSSPVISGAPYSGFPVLPSKVQAASRQNGWFAILTRLFNHTEGLCLFPTSAGWSVCDSCSKALQSHRNLPFLSLLQTYTLLRTYIVSIPNPRQMNGLRFSQGSPITSSSHCIYLFLRFSP